MSKTTRWRFAPVLLIGSLFLSACSGDETPTAGAGAAPTNTPSAITGASGSPGAFIFDPATYKKNEVEPDAELRVSSWGDISEQQVVLDSLDRFNQVYPDVKITYEPVPSDYRTKLLMQISSDTQPDVFYLDVDLPYKLIPDNELLDLAPALTEVGRSKDDYFPVLMDALLGKDDKHAPDGKVYGLPKDFTSMAVFYNSDLVKTVPRAGWTQDDFTVWVKENTTGSNQTRVFGFASDPLFFPYWGNFAIANGAKVIDNNRCTINSPAGVSTLDWLNSLYKDKFLTLSADLGASWEGEIFARKRSASIVVGSWVNPFLNDPNAALGIHYDAVPLPVGKTGARATILGFAGWGASAKSKFPRAAAALVLFLTSHQNEDAILQTGFALPSLKGMENDSFFQGSGTVNKISKILYDGANYGTLGVWGGEANSNIQQALNDATDRVFLQMQTAKQALDQACLEIDAALAAVH